MTGCPFCKRIEAGDYAGVSHGVVSFEPLRPVTPGHLLVIPREHVRDATTAPHITAEVMRQAAVIAGQLPTGANLITSIGAEATQTVRHLHVHVVPRREGDGLHLPWTGQDRRLRCMNCRCPLDDFPECTGSCGHVDRDLRGCVIEPLLEAVAS